jgi:DNA repair protein RadC
VDLLSNGSKAIRDLSFNERPREKALAIGIKQLSNKELLAILLASGIKGRSVLVIAESILNTHGSLIALSRLGMNQWMQISGINKIKALQMMTVFEIFQRLEKSDLPMLKLNDPNAIFENFRLRMGSLNHEQLLIIKLNHQYRYQSETVFRLGSQSNIQLDYRDLFVDLLKTDTKKFILIHNHPSGDVTPSQEDIHTTIGIKKAAKELGFILVDHLILSTTAYFSMRQQKII